MPEICEAKFAGNSICEASSDGFNTLMYQEKELVWKGKSTSTPHHNSIPKDNSERLLALSAGCVYTQDKYSELQHKWATTF